VSENFSEWLKGLHKVVPPAPRDDFMPDWAPDDTGKRAAETNERHSLTPESIGGAVIEQLRNLRARRAAVERDRADRRAMLEGGTLSDTAEEYRTRLLADLKTGTELDAVPDPEPLIDGLLYRNTVNYLAGASGAFKTIAALDMAARVGKGEPFCGMTVARGKVLYVIAEGLTGMKFRRQAWESYHNGGEQMENVTFVPYAVQIANESEMSALIAVAVSGQYDMIVFDTQAMCTVGVDENSNSEMAMVVDSLLILARLTNAAVLMVHHTGKDESLGMRGASGQYANVNTVIVAKREGSGKQIVLSTARARGGKQKDAREIHSMRFNIEEVGASIVMTQGVLEDDVIGGTGVVTLRGKHDVSILNTILTRENIPVTQTQIRTYMTEGGSTISKGYLHERLSALVELGVIKQGQGLKFHVTDLGRTALRDMAAGDGS
jgi:hypothetical protein